MNVKPVSTALIALVILASGCGASRFVLKVRTDPAGAKVYLSRRGEKSYRGKLGIVKGDFKSEPVEEEFVPLGTTPLEHSSPLEEREGGASALGFGVILVRKYDSGMIRVERDGYTPVERLVRFKDGELKVDLKLERGEGGLGAGVSVEDGPQVD